MFFSRVLLVWMPFGKLSLDVVRKSVKLLESCNWRKMFRL